MLQQHMLLLCDCFWLTLSRLLIMSLLTTNFDFVNAAGDQTEENEVDPIEEMFKLNGQSAKDDVDHYQDDDQQKSQMFENDYPLAREQLERRISTHEMHQRMECTIKISHCHSDYGRAWNDQLRKLHSDTIGPENKKTLLKSKTGKNQQEKMMETTPRHPIQGLQDDPGRSRLAVVWEALEKAANIKPDGIMGKIKQLSGNTDSTDLIELLVTLSNEEKFEIQQKMGLNGMVNYCQLMAKNSEVNKNPPFESILSALCQRFRDDDFAIKDSYDSELKKIQKFIENPRDNYSGIGNLLATSNYMHLRALNEAMKQSYNYNFSGNGLYEWAKHHYESKSNKKNEHIWKLIKAIGAEIEFGRSRLFAEILREKIEKILADKNVNDSFGDITRIVLTRAPLDLADINEAYEQTSEEGITLYDHLEVLEDSKYPEGTKGHMTIESYQQIIEWAVGQMNNQFSKLATASTNNPLKIREYVMSKEVYAAKTSTSSSFAGGHHGRKKEKKATGVQVEAVADVRQSFHKPDQSGHGIMLPLPLPPSAYNTSSSFAAAAAAPARGQRSKTKKEEEEPAVDVQTGADEKESFHDELNQNM